MLTQHLSGTDMLPGEGVVQEAEKNEKRLEQNGIRRSSKGRKNYFNERITSLFLITHRISKDF